MLKSGKCQNLIFRFFLKYPRYDNDCFTEVKYMPWAHFEHIVDPLNVLSTRTPWCQPPSCFNAKIRGVLQQMMDLDNKESTNVD